MRFVRMMVVRVVVVAIGAFGCRSEGPTSSGSSRSATTTATTSSASSRPHVTPPIAIDPACRVDGCLRSAALVGHYDKATIAALIAPGVQIDNGYSVHTIAFFTSGREARATLAVPYPAVPPAGGYHLVANNHGTTGLDDPCAVAGTIAGAGRHGLGRTLARRRPLRR